jgi:hypothetical protein
VTVVEDNSESSKRSLKVTPGGFSITVHLDQIKTGNEDKFESYRGNVDGEPDSTACGIAYKAGGDWQVFITAVLSDASVLALDPTGNGSIHNVRHVPLNLEPQGNTAGLCHSNGALRKVDLMRGTERAVLRDRALLFDAHIGVSVNHEFWQYFGPGDAIEIRAAAYVMGAETFFRWKHNGEKRGLQFRIGKDMIWSPANGELEKDLSGTKDSATHINQVRDGWLLKNGKNRVHKNKRRDIVVHLVGSNLEEGPAGQVKKLDGVASGYAGTSDAVAIATRKDDYLDTCLIVAHEVGHTLGLEHCTEPDCGVMFPDSGFPYKGFSTRSKELLNTKTLENLNLDCIVWD